MSVYLPVRALNRSQNIRIGKGATAVKLSTTTTSYVDITNADVKRDLQRHSAIGAYTVVGGLTASNVDEVVTTGGVVTAHSSGLKVDVTAGEMKIRSTGVFVAGAANTAGLSLTTAHATKDRTDLIWWDGAAGTVGKTDGTVATAGSSVAPATPAGKVPLATVLVAATVTVPGAITDVRPRA